MVILIPSNHSINIYLDMTQNPNLIEANIVNSWQVKLLCNPTGVADNTIWDKSPLPQLV